ncbi:MAG: nuclear transport factor 2 family protein [Ignavibacteriaceae bacterium]
MKEDIIEIVNKLFVYTDNKEWDKLQKEVFTDTVDFDMLSLGGEVTKKTSRQICEEWNKGFEGLDAVNHLAGNYIIDIDSNSANVFAYATATHYKSSAINGKTREFVGSYNLHLVKTDNAWRIDRFKYNLKYATGNLDLK